MTDRIEADRRLADDVASLLSRVGFTVSRTDRRAAGGVVVSVEPELDPGDLLAGVWVHWRVSEELVDAFAPALLARRFDDPLIALSAAATRAVTQALESVLTGAGCTVRRGDNDLDDDGLHVVAGPGAGTVRA